MRDTFGSYLSPSVRGEQDDESRTNTNRRLEAESPSACGQHHGQFLNDGIDLRILRIIENHQQQLLVRVARQIGARAQLHERSDLTGESLIPGLQIPDATVAHSETAENGVSHEGLETRAAYPFYDGGEQHIAAVVVSELRARQDSNLRPLPSEGSTLSS